MKKNLIPWKGSHGLKHYDPNDMFSEFQKHMNSFFNGFMDNPDFMPVFGGKGSGFNPKFDFVETKTSYEVKAEMPGLTEKDVDVSIDNNVLTVKGEKKEEKKEEKKNYYYSERSFGTFERSFELSKDIDMENIKANFKNGELSVSLPKKEVEESKVKKIKVNG